MIPILNGIAPSLESKSTFPKNISHWHSSSHGKNTYLCFCRIKKKNRNTFNIFSLLKTHLNKNPTSFLSILNFRFSFSHFSNRNLLICTAGCTVPIRKIQSIPSISPTRLWRESMSVPNPNHSSPHYCITIKLHFDTNVH